MVKILGAKSGFKTSRDLALFLIGTGILVWHLANTPAAKVSIPLLIFCAGMMGAPYIIGRDEQKRE